MRRAIFIIVILLLLAFGAFRVGQWLVRPRIEATPKPTAYTPADGPKLDTRDVPKLTAIDEEYTVLVEKVLPAVVSITSKRITQLGPAGINPLDLLYGKRRGGQPQPQTETSLGSGVIVSREGHVLTNNHVVEGMNEIVVQLSDERTFTARLLGTDPDVDIAVLKIDGPNLDPLPIGNSDNVRVGQLVFAIGNPFGLSETVTAGIISAKSRRAMRDATVEYLQTDAAVNQGNSGGPLINLRGEIIGINTAIYSRSEDAGWMGISFAVPSNVARRALDSVLKRGRIARSYLGVTMTNLSPELAASLHTDSTEGAVVTDIVPGSPAERAGVRPRDILRSFNGRPLRDMSALRSRLNEVDIGTRVELGVIREGAEMRLTAEIGEAPKR
ncbi:MAG: trypsin-like peptidase domain-containing protein [Chthoniobacteraceae bacterium]